MKQRAIFLDRDGVLNRGIIRDGRPYPPASVAELEVLPGVREALDRLKAAGYALVVVTNQPDVARGSASKDTIDAINARLMQLLPLDEIRVCYHDDPDRCSCRKPSPGMLLDPPTYDVAASVMVGDRWRDIEAGRRAGCRATILIGYAYDERPAEGADCEVHSLAEAADWILERWGPLTT